MFVCLFYFRFNFLKLQFKIYKVYNIYVHYVHIIFIKIPWKVLFTGLYQKFLTTHEVFKVIRKCLHI